MFDLHPKRGYDEIKALSILAGDKPCVICGKGIASKFRRLTCDTCKWHYRRKKYHAVYCYMLRAHHQEANTEWWRGVGREGNASCAYCRNYYGVTNSREYAKLEEDRV